MQAHFALVDILLLAGYFGFTLFVGFRSRVRTTDDFMIASRSLSLPVFVATLVATWYGGILAVGEFTYQAGLANWTTQGLPYYLFALIYAFFLASKVRGASAYTIPDRITATFGRPAGLIAALFAFIMVTPAPYILMAGQIVSIAFGWPLLPSLLLGTVFSMVYVYVGGFESDIRINVFQFLLMFAGFAFGLGTLMLKFGGFGWLSSHLPPAHLTLTGGQDSGFILVWFFIALLTLVDPGFHQRCSAAKNPSVAKWGIVAAVGCWAIFDFLTTSTGLYAKAALPNLTEAQQPFAFPLLAEAALPPFVKGIFYIAMLATVMSTVVSYTFMGAMTVGRDFLWRLRDEEHNENVPRYTRIGLTLATGLGIVIAIAVPSVVKQWFAIGTVFVPGLLLPLLACYYPMLRIHPALNLVAMVGGTGSALGCLVTGWIKHGLTAETVQFPFHTQPMYAGLGFAVVVWGVGLALRPGTR
ncbi:MAG: sodium:solute symporter family protein [Chthonomonadales bacterium]